jgi:uncharacterized protein (DUF885 family)
VRYSCDIPAQGLAYKIGDVEFMKLRDHMARSLGTRFDIREFHYAVLATGVVPLPDLEWHIAFVIGELQSRQVITTPGSI